MAGLAKKNIDKPDEVRQMKDGKGRVELVDLGSGLVARAIFEPGWRWSEHVKPIAGTDSCQAAHVGYVISGRMKIVMDDGEEIEVGPGDFMMAAPGHDAWTLGDEACVVVDWQGMTDYAKS
jgi:quercetin dioxygenase-like cupin family protein